MKSKILFGIVLFFLTAAISGFVHVNNERKSVNSLFDANVEVLTRYEILVGDLCMQCPGYACSSLGEVYLEHYPA